MVLQKLNYTENPVDIPNPDRGAYRGRWQNIPPALVNEVNSPFGITPEVDHRVPVDENSVLYHGRQVPPVEGDDIEPTEFFNGINQNDKPYIGGTGVSAVPSISFMAFDLVNFSSNAFLSAADAFVYKDDGLLTDPLTGKPRTGKTQPLTPFALDYIRGLLQKVREGEGTALVKFSYDGNGFNYVEPFKYPHLNLTEGLIRGPEPEGMCGAEGHGDKNWIEYHIFQLVPVFAEFEDVIMCVKTGMVGAWGEQHSSPMSRDPKTYKFLLDAYLEAVPASRSLLTHAGGFLAWYNATYGTAYNFFNIDTMPVPKRGTPEARFGFFNDSYAAGGDDASDNGSLSEGGEMLLPCAEDYGYDRARILTWIHKQNNFVQGEGGLQENEFSRMPNAIVEACRLRTTALNMRHGKYTTWSGFVYKEENFAGSAAFFDPVYDGKNGLEYFRDRMGYRLVLRETRMDEHAEADGVLRVQLKIQNVGFGNVINKKRVTVLLKPEDDSAFGDNITVFKDDNSYFIAGTGIDARDWLADENGNGYFTADTDIDARDWLTDENGNGRADNFSAWREVSVDIGIPAFSPCPENGTAITPGTYNVYLKINDPKEKSANKRCIRFANHYIWDAGLGANKIGVIRIGIVSPRVI
ncbi:MAG: DUF4832 domain-containing protein [Defluviitaleaceae bacterium]|nr:DUF4832 domain-containing protein [Defluviitaleaceae bacterium]